MRQPEIDKGIETERWRGSLDTKHSREDIAQKLKTETYGRERRREGRGKTLRGSSGSEIPQHGNLERDRNPERIQKETQPVMGRDHSGDADRHCMRQRDI